MILVDTSIWIDHLHRPKIELSTYLRQSRVYTHPGIVGELLCGNIKNRAELSDLLRELPIPPLKEHQFIFDFIERHVLWGKGLGWIDVNLLVTALNNDLVLWTSDSRLKGVAEAHDVRCHR